MNRSEAGHWDDVGLSADSQLVAAMREYQDALDAGQRLDRRAFLARHAAVADELADCLDGLLALSGMLPPPMDLSSGGAPIGDFRIVREIGRGGMGIVYEAEQLSLHRRVALKVLPFAATLDSRQLQRFRNEATAAAHLHHPNIVQVYGVGCDRGVHYYAMQFINGRTLADVVRQLSSESLADENARVHRHDTHRWTATPPVNPDWDLGFKTWDHTPRGPRPTSEYFRVVARWIVQAADGLEHAHQLGIIHRDIKPANLLLDADGRVCIADFGLAHITDSDALTHTGDVIGTLRYMSPEQARGERGSDPRGDVYSLGVTLYELLTLQSPFPARDREALRQQILHEEPRSARQAQPTLPAELNVIAHKAMSKSPTERYSSAAALADDLRAWLDDRPIRGRPPTWMQRSVKWARRHRAVVATAAVGLVAATITLGAATAIIAAKHSQVQAALGERNDALRHLSDRQQKTDDALRAESEAKATLSQSLARETQNAYSYRLPLAQQAIRDADWVQATRLLNDCPAPLRGWEWQFLEQRLSAPMQALRAPTSRPSQTRIAISPDGRTVVAVAKSQAPQPARIESWELTTGNSLRSMTVPIGDGSEIALSPDARRFAAFHRNTVVDSPADRRVAFFNVSTGERAQSWSASAGIACLQWRPDGHAIAIAGLDGSLVVHGAADGREIRTLRRTGDPIAEIAWSPNGETLVAASSAENLRELNRTNRTEQLAEVTLYDVASCQTQWTTHVPLQPPFPIRSPRLLFSPGGRYLAISTGLTTPARIVDAKSGETIALPADAAVVAIAPNGKFALGVLSTGIGLLFDLDSQRVHASLRFREPKRIKAGSFELNRGRSAAEFSHDGRFVAFAHDDGRISIWNTATGHEFCTLPGISKTTSLRWSSDDRHLATAAVDGSVARWDLDEATEHRMLANAEAQLAYSSLAVSPDGTTLAAVRSARGPDSSEPAAVVLWELPSGRLRHVLPAPVLGVGWAMPGSGELYFSADGQKLVAAGIVRDGPPMNWFCRVLNVWNVEQRLTLKSRRDRLTFQGPISINAAEPLMPNLDLDLFRARCGRDDRCVQLFAKGRSVEHSAERSELELFLDDNVDRPWSPSGAGRVRCASLSSDGSRCCITRSGGENDQQCSSLEVWDVVHRRLLWRIASPTTAKRLAAVFSPDGRRILTQPTSPATDADEPWTRHATVWDADSGELLCHFAPPAITGPYGERLNSRFVFSHDASRLASFGATTGIKIWDANSGRCLLTIGESAGVVGEAVLTAPGLLVARDERGAILYWDGREHRRSKVPDALVRSLP